MNTVSAGELAQLAGTSRTMIMSLYMAGGLRLPGDEIYPPLPDAVDLTPGAPRWETAAATTWATEWRATTQTTQDARDADERAAQEQWAARAGRLPPMVPVRVLGVPAYTPASLPAPGSRPNRFLLVRQEPLHWDHGRLIAPRWLVSGHRAGETVTWRDLPGGDPDGMPTGREMDGALRAVAREVGTQALDAAAELFRAADPTRWQRAAAALQAMITARVVEIGNGPRPMLHGPGREVAAAWLTPGRAADGGLNSVHKRMQGWRGLTPQVRADALTLGRALGLDPDHDLTYADRTPPDRET